MAMDAEKWITVHPNGPDHKGRPVKIDEETGKIVAGLGVEYNGIRLSDLSKTTKSLSNKAVESIKGAFGFRGKKFRKISEMSRKEVLLDKKENLIQAQGGVTIPQAKGDPQRKSIIGKIHAGGHILDVTRHKTGWLCLSTGFKGSTIIVGYYPKDLPWGDIKVLADQDAKSAIADWSTNKIAYVANREKMSFGRGIYHSYHPEHVGINQTSRSDPMDHSMAAGSSCNPKYATVRGCKTNCQSCVLAYEARRRGYDVCAMPKDSKDRALKEMLSLHPEAAYINPNTGYSPDVKSSFDGVLWRDCSSVKKMELICNAIGNGHRGVLKYLTKMGSGHVVNIVCDSGKPFIFDPQRGVEYRTSVDIDKFMSSDNMREFRGVFRTDDCDLNMAFAERVLR